MCPHSFKITVARWVGFEYKKVNKNVSIHFLNHCLAMSEALSIKGSTSTFSLKKQQRSILGNLKIQQVKQTYINPHLNTATQRRSL